MGTGRFMTYSDRAWAEPWTEFFTLQLQLYLYLYLYFSIRLVPIPVHFPVPLKFCLIKPLYETGFQFPTWGTGYAINQMLSCLLLQLNQHVMLITVAVVICVYWLHLLEVTRASVPPGCCSTRTEKPANWYVQVYSEIEDIECSQI